MPRGDSCPLGLVISHNSGGDFLYKEERPSFLERTSKGETRTGRHFLNAGRLSESAGEQMSEAENFLPNLAGGRGLAGAKVRLLRPINCANSPWWFGGLAWGESKLTSSYQLC